METQREIESKFDVAPDFRLEDVDELLQAGDVLQITDHELVSVYYDTPESDLQRSRLTLRRRSGTSDTGWHLKVPGDGFRTELRWSLADHDSIPDPLSRLIAPFSHGNELASTVQLKIQRRRHQIRTADGSLRLEIADDQVWATEAGAPVRTRRWREVEVELGDAGTPADLARAAAFLRSRGAHESAYPSKLARAHAPSDEQTPPAEGTAAAVLLDYLTMQCDGITSGHFAVSYKPFEPELTLQPHEAVHKTRVAIRRIRANLRVFAPLFDAARSSRMDSELQWYAGLLGEVRDREVLRIRLGKAVYELPSYLVVGPVADRIDGLMSEELHHYADILMDAMRSPRYHDLIDDLGQWRTSPPFSPAAFESAETLGEYLDAAERRLARRLRKAAKPNSTEDALHAARKAGKRARYAAEAAAPALGMERSDLATRAATLQTLLGEHQDAVIATTLLRRIADQLWYEGGNAFTYGVLVADQRRIAAEAAREAHNVLR